MNWMLILTIFFVNLTTKIVNSSNVPDDCYIGQKSQVTEDCNSYLECVSNVIGSPFGKWVPQICENFYHFDSVQNECVEATTSDCVCKDNDKIPIPDECIWYYQCSRGEYIPLRCPRKSFVGPSGLQSWSVQMFDPKLRQCVDKQKISVENDCTSYMECVINKPVSPFEKWVTFKCAQSLHFEPDTKTCVDPSHSSCVSDPCLNSPCLNGGTCNPKGADLFTCSCIEGFTGENCQYSNACSNEPCLNGGTCFSDASGSYLCSCTNGFNGINCENNQNYAQCILILRGHANSVLNVIKIKNTTLASASRDNTIKIWNILSGTCQMTLNGHTDFVTSLLNDDYLASGSWDKTIKVWNYVTGKCIKTLTEHTGAVTSLVRLSNGYLISGSWDNTIKIWHTLLGESMQTLRGHTDFVSSLVLLDGHLASGSDDGTIRIWNVVNGNCLTVLHGHEGPVSSLVSLSDGLLASGSWDMSIKIWDILSGDCMQTMKGHRNSVSSLTMMSNGYLVSGSFDSTINNWDIQKAECVHTLNGHLSSVSTVAVLDKGFLASGSSDKMVKIWNVK